MAWLVIQLRRKLTGPTTIATLVPGPWARSQERLGKTKKRKG